MGFSPTVNQRILPPTFPRYTKIKARDFSISFLEELVHRTKQACKIIHCVNYHSALVRTLYQMATTTIDIHIFNCLELLHRIQQEIRAMLTIA